MSSIRTKTPKSFSNPILALVLIVGFSLCLTQAQQLRQGISVQMAHTANATAYPAADNDDAWILTVTADGNVYFGVKPVTPDQLSEQMKITPRHRDAKLYIKADTRAPFANVEKGLEAAHEVGFEGAVLLTTPQVSPAPGTLVPPNGLEVLIGPALPAGTVATVVQLLNSQQQRPVLTVNGDEIPWSTLQDTLRRHFQKGDAKGHSVESRRAPSIWADRASDRCVPCNASQNRSRHGRTLELRWQAGAKFALCTSSG